MNKIQKNPYYIYNFTQVNWLLQQGCVPIEAGEGAKGDLYLKFPRIPEVEEKINIWKSGRAVLSYSIDK